MFGICHKLRVFRVLHFQAKTSGEGRQIDQGNISTVFFYVGHAKKLKLYPTVSGAPEISFKILSITLCYCA